MATKDNREYALATWKAAEAAGADCVTLCDTNGGLAAGGDRRDHAVRAAHLTAQLGIHTHDDIGLGVANALAGLDAGATHVQGTINGYGERTGNCNITSVMPILQFKLQQANVPAESFPQLKELSQFVDETANIRPNPRLPWVGSAAFSHKGGAHVNAVQKVHPQLRAHRPGAHRQRAPRADQRPGRPQQHRDEGAGTRLRHHQQHAAAARHAHADQGSRAPGLRVRVGRRLARAAHPPCDDDASAAVRGRRVPRVGPARRRHVKVRGDRQGARRR